jgi:hypothetical protein
LHQLLIQWIGDETLHPSLLQPIQHLLHDNIKCLWGLDLSDYELISCTKDGFVPAVLKPIENWLNHLM